MASTTFTFKTTIIPSAWLNDVNTLVWTVFNGATTAALARTALGLGTIATQNANAVAITGGTIDNTSVGATTRSTGAFTTLALTTALSPANGGIGATGTPTNGQIPIGNGTNYTPATLTAGTGITITNGAGTITVAGAAASPIRQTVLSGPVDSNGLPNFGGATGSTTVTASGTLICSFANGFGSGGAVDSIGSIVNPSWTGLSTNGTMYLYVDYNSGSPTTGSVTLAPVYQFGGTYSTTNNQHTFNIQEMIMKVGNGSTASQTNRVFVGEVTVAGGVVTAITWYALMGRYTAPYTATLPSGAFSLTANHNIGVDSVQSIFEIKNTTTDGGYAVGDILTPGQGTGSAAISVCVIAMNYKVVSFGGTTGVSFDAPPKTGGGTFTLTLASWSYRFRVWRTW